MKDTNSKLSNSGKKDVLELLRSGENVLMNHPDIGTLAKGASAAFRVLKAFNQEYDLEKGRNLFSELIGKEVVETTRVYPPFYTNYGKNITIGNNVFINHDCSMLDLGGIDIKDDVMIGPRVSITSENHPTDIETRKTLVPGKVVIKKNAWIGGGVFILPGVTIGENSVVAAGAVVTQNVPNNVVVGGVPAKILKQFK